MVGLRPLEASILVRVQVWQQKISQRFLRKTWTRTREGSGEKVSPVQEGSELCERWKTVGFQAVKIQSLAARKFGIIKL